MNHQNLIRVPVHSLIQQAWYLSVKIIDQWKNNPQEKKINILVTAEKALNLK